jgi:hypothetical protein
MRAAVDAWARSEADNPSRLRCRPQPGRAGPYREHEISGLGATAHRRQVRIDLFVVELYSAQAARGSANARCPVWAAVLKGLARQ